MSFVDDQPTVRAASRELFPWPEDSPMTALRLILPLVSVVFYCGRARDDASGTEPRPARDMRLMLNGTVRMPGGSPAAGAIVEAKGELDGPPIVAHADGLGRFEIRGVFGNGAQ